MRPLLCLGFITILYSCKTTEDASLKASSQCTAPVDISKYLNQRHQCFSDNVFSDKKEVDRRLSYSWLPCNEVEWIDQRPDLFGAKGSDALERLSNSTHKRTFDHLGKDKPNIRFEGSAGLERIKNILSNPKKNPDYLNSPIFEGQLPQKISELISGARDSIFADVFLLGGTWGIEIARQLVLAADRGVKVLLLHDTVSYFTVKQEMENLWLALTQVAESHQNLIVLASEISPPLRPSSLPFGFDKLSPIVDNLTDLSISSEGKSDHSKVIIVDALQSAPKGSIPKALVSSRNMVNSASAYYHDEAVIISGPAAGLSLLHYYPDIFWAFQSASGAYGKSKSPAIGTRKLESIMDQWLKPIFQMRTNPTFVEPVGNIAVQALEVAAQAPRPDAAIKQIPNTVNDVRNLDAGILSVLKGARKRVYLYGRIAYNRSLAKTLANLISRGVDVKVILDQQVPGSALMNATLPWMIAEFKPKQTSIIKEEDLPVKWFLPFRPSYLDDDIPPLNQEIHAKTIIVDDRFTLFGSTNMDSFTWLGGFREYSAWIDSPKIAKQTSAFFEDLWAHSYLTVSHKVWSGKAAPMREVLAYYRNEFMKNPERVSADCDQRCIDEKILEVVQGGRNYNPLGSSRKIVRDIITTNERRTKALQWETVIESCPTTLD